MRPRPPAAVASDARRVYAPRGVSVRAAAYAAGIKIPEPRLREGVGLLLADSMFPLGGILNSNECKHTILAISGSLSAMLQITKIIRVDMIRIG